MLPAFPRNPTSAEPRERSETTLQASIAGAHFYSQSAPLIDGATVTLAFEPNNPHDPCAISIWAGREQIGYVNASDARRLCEMKSEGWSIDTDAALSDGHQAVDIRCSHPMALQPEYAILGSELICIPDQIERHRKAGDSALHHLLLRLHLTEEARTHALAALENGTKDSCIRAFAARIFAEEGAHQKAYELRKELFEYHPTLSHYRELRSSAEQLSFEQEAKALAQEAFLSAENAYLKACAEEPQSPKLKDMLGPARAGCNAWTRVLYEEGSHDQALLMIEAGRTGPKTALNICIECFGLFPERTEPLIIKVLDGLIAASKSNHSFEKAGAYISKALSQMEYDRAVHWMQRFRENNKKRAGVLKMLDSIERDCLARAEAGTLSRTCAAAGAPSHAFSL